MSTSINIANHPEGNYGIELIEKHITHEDPKYNNLNIQTQNDSEFNILDRFFNISEYDDGNDRNIFSKDDRIANAKDNGCCFLNKKKESPEEENQQKSLKYKKKRKFTKRKKLKVMKKFKKELEKVYFRILGEKKKFKFRKIFVKLLNKKYYQRYILENPFIKELFLRNNIYNRRIFRKIQKKIFYRQFERMIAAKIRYFSDGNKCFAHEPKNSNNLGIDKKSNDKIFIFNK